MSKENHENPMSIRSKNAFAKALLTLMMQKDFDEITISDIALEAGLARQTFYSNFTKKEDILEYLLSEFFGRYLLHIASLAKMPDNLIVDYFIFWNEQKSFLSLLFKRNLGHLFCEKNRDFFENGLACYDSYFSADIWLRPYIRSALAGLTFELLRLWITNGNGLSIAVLNALAANSLSGRIFFENRT